MLRLICSLFTNCQRENEYCSVLEGKRNAGPRAGEAYKRVKGSRAGETVQFVECLVGKHEDESSIPSTPKLSGGMLVTTALFATPGLGK